MEEKSKRKRGRLQLESLICTLENEPLLKDVPPSPTLADVHILISLELGSAMKLFILRMDSTMFDVALPNSATVKDLKSVVANKVNAMEQFKMGHRHISWRHVWANFCLCYGDQKLVDEKTMLQDFGIRTNSQIHFTPHVASRECGRHSRRKKRRFFHGLNKHS